MSELLGIIAPLRKFLSNSKESIKVQVDGKPNEILALEKDREYFIPDFQREIRWDKDNLSQLIDDINLGPKYLGNIILTQKTSENKFLIIDGQQRMTVLTLILTCLDELHNGQIDTIIPCKLTIESFSGFEKVINNKFLTIYEDLSIDILKTDKLRQLKQYYKLWNEIRSNECISNRRKAGNFLENLCESNVNIILNRSDDLKIGIRYFIDVNLKGRQLDTEDIFKGYLFRKDSSNEIREEWYTLKTNVSEITTTKMKYPLLKLLEHYFYCDLYNDARFKGLLFDEEFLLKNEFKIHEENGVKFRARTHIIEVIDDKTYMLNSLRRLNKVIEIMINIVNSKSTNDMFTKLFENIEIDGKKKRLLDSDELEVIHNLIGKILKDDKLLPKALIMKFILTVLGDNVSRTKFGLKKIYGVYLLSVLFVIFENNKSKDVFMNVLKASDENWYTETVRQINSYFETDKITDSKIVSQFKKGLNEDEEDYKFRCKSLATVYNYFKIENDKVILCGNLSDIKCYLTDDRAFTTEHLIISESQKMQMNIIIDKKEILFEHEKEFFKRYVINLFNFIFIDEELNESLKNYWLPYKLILIEEGEINCDYSKMIVSYLKTIGEKMQEGVTDANSKDRLDLFFMRDFKELYIEYARNVLDEVIKKIKSKC